MGPALRPADASAGLAGAGAARRGVQLK
jgi:hypothetical protein